MIMQMKTLSPGFLLAAVIGLAAQGVGSHYDAPVMLFALLFGIALSFLHTNLALQPGIDWTGRTVLRVGIGLLGIRVAFQDLFALGWVMAALFGAERFENYQAKTALLHENRIALWDVLRHCRRRGSLDSAIQNDTIVTNDFETFLASHRQIRHIFFNGGKAEAEFLKRVKPVLPPEMTTSLALARLPSTSPAMASLSLSQKCAAWQAVKEAAA